MKFLKIRPVKDPTRGTSKSAGIDLYIPFEITTIELKPGESTLIPSGLKVDVPKNHVFVAMNKSGIATKKGLSVGACVIDEDYQGEIHIHLTNISNNSTTIEGGDKIVQCLILPINYEGVEIVESEDQMWNGEVTERGSGGFGSTGTK
jgi:dUTP pyrophosphatase